ncbi:MAG: trypsin-like peptidase domain-containing protein, partial [Dehalococcoidia bacterium]
MIYSFLAALLATSVSACGQLDSPPSPTQDTPATVRAVVSEEIAKSGQSQSGDAVLRGNSRERRYATARQSAGSPALCAGEDPTIKVMPSLVEVTATKGEGVVTGSGFIVDGERGLIVTATHVVSTVDPDSIEIVFRNGVTRSARWVAQEPATDV